MRRLCMDLGPARANFEQVVWHWRQHQLPIPQLESVSLSIKSWDSVWDVAVVLGIFGKHMKELALSTNQLQLAFVQQQPPRNPFLYPSCYAVRLPRIDSHALGECFDTDECNRPNTPLADHIQSPQVASDHPSWFLQLMSPLRPRFYPRSFETLHKLRFEVSHWRSAMETEANGELSIVVRVGTDFCLNNASAVNEPNWRSLEKLVVTVRSRTTCLCAVEEKFRVLLEWMKKSMLPLLNMRGIVDVTYIPLESTILTEKEMQ